MGSTKGYGIKKHFKPHLNSNITYHNFHPEESKTNLTCSEQSRLKTPNDFSFQMILLNT